MSTYIPTVSARENRMLKEIKSGRRKMHLRDFGGGLGGSTRCGANALTTVNTTRKKHLVTCKTCRKLMVLDGLS